MKIVIVFILSLFLFSCSKEEEMDISMQGKYDTDFLEVIPAVDLNRDGIASTNLLDEKSSYADNSRFYLELKVNTYTRSYLFNQAFPSAGIKNGNEVSLETNSILILYNRKGNILTPVEEGGEMNLISAKIIDENTIEVHSYAELLLPDGMKRVEMKATYTRRK
ncbi:MAG: hypothetical protein COZ18_12770 [Flexibacter sp. CG_4_10_14_3_um_filter_32_15]|nr:MAG: hypothetical protein COZ18_12770 [Flexibacter sp. CG_4_10_14_3_um_filter_32_15]